MIRSYNAFLIRSYKIFLRFVGITRDKTSRHLFRLFQIATYIIIGLFLVDISSIYFGSEPFGQFGDFFGGVANPILTFLTFMGLIMTIIIQKKELVLTRKEMRDSSNALRQQVINQDKQRFEDTFFSLLDEHNRILTNITSYDEMDSETSMVAIVRNNLIGGPLIFNEDTESVYEKKDKLLKMYPQVNQYARVLYQILKFVASNCPTSTVKDSFSSGSLKKTTSSKEEKLYTSIIRSFLSEDIYYLLLINCFCESEDDQFFEYKLLIERYAFFEHFGNHNKRYNTHLIDKLVRSYDEKAFGDNRRVDDII